MIELRDVIDLIWTEDTPIYIFTAEKEKFDYREKVTKKVCLSVQNEENKLFHQVSR